MRPDRREAYVAAASAVAGGRQARAVSPKVTSSTVVTAPTENTGRSTSIPGEGSMPRASPIGVQRDTRAIAPRATTTAAAPITRPWAELRSKRSFRDHPSEVIVRSTAAAPDRYRANVGPSTKSEVVPPSTATSQTALASVRRPSSTGSPMVASSNTTSNGATSGVAARSSNEVPGSSRTAICSPPSSPPPSLSGSSSANAGVV